MLPGLSKRIVIVAVALLLGLSGAAPVVSGAERMAAQGSQAGAVQAVDLNQASAEQLITIPGIGKVMAQRIIDFREQHGPFNRVEDLMKVKGIGEKSLQKLRPYVKVSKPK
jgi:competence protein ComEA